MNNCARCLLYCIHCQSLVASSVRRTAVFALWGVVVKQEMPQRGFCWESPLHAGVAVLNCGFRRTSGLLCRRGYQRAKGQLTLEQPTETAGADGGVKLKGRKTSRSQQNPDPSKFKEKQDQERRKTPTQNAAISRAVRRLRRDIAAFKKTRSIILCRTGNRWPPEASCKHYRQRFCSTSFEEPFGQRNQS